MNAAKVEFHRAEDAQERGEGICRTCLEPIWNEGGTIDHRHRDEGWSDRIERGGDSLVCFKAVDYRHVPLDGREACIYDRAFARGHERETSEFEASRDLPANADLVGAVAKEMRAADQEADASDDTIGWDELAEVALAAVRDFRPSVLR